MFTVNKSSASLGSRQSSAISLVTVPSTSISASEAWPSQGFGASSAGLPLPERQHSKRSSVFTLRSRSNTATSTSSYASVTSPTMDKGEQYPRQSSGHSFMDLNDRKKSMFRGKKGKRLSGTFALDNICNEVEDSFGSRRASVLRKSRWKEPAPPPAPSCNLKHRISSPFDFQHVSHTDRHQFTTLDQASEHQLVAKFSAVRASQVATNHLYGIKADLIRSPRAEGETRDEDRPPAPPPKDFSRPDLRTSRSIESFSRPGINLRAHRHTQSANAPPRTSSRGPSSPVNNVTEESIRLSRNCYSPPSSRSNRQSGLWDRYVPYSSPSMSGQLPTMTEESDFVGHALTTPDNSAIHAVTPPFSPGLEDVAEEPTEKYVHPRRAPSPPDMALYKSESPTFDSFSFSSPQSPVARSRSYRVSYSSPTREGSLKSYKHPIANTQELSMSPTLPSLVRRPSVRKPSASSRKFSNCRDVEESWEDEIDYIYDNALEADCDHDWDNNGQSAVQKNKESTSKSSQTVRTSYFARPCSSIYEEDMAAEYQYYPSSLHLSPYVRKISSIPELEPRSAVSSSTAESGVRTPSDIFIPPNTRKASLGEAIGFALTPSLLVPQDFKEEVARNTMYSDILAEYEDSSSHFPFFDATCSTATSARSSRLQSSQRSSNDSSLMSGEQPSESWFGARQSGGSSGSLPELVHSSRHARRNLDTMIDRLSEQVASLSAIDDDEEAITQSYVSPGCTFLASDDEGATSTEDVMKNSLELVRQGSTHSARIPHYTHTYASSDGAAKMLTQPASQAPERQPLTTSRSRAASSSQVQRGARNQQFSLFPSPPSRSPLASPTRFEERNTNMI